MPGNALGCPSQGRMEIQALRPAERRAIPRRPLPAHSPLFGQVCSECSSSTSGLAHPCSFITCGPRCPPSRKPFLNQSDNGGWMPLPCAVISTDHSCLISHLDCAPPRAGTVSHSPLYPLVQGVAGSRQDSFDFDGGGITEQVPEKSASQRLSAGESWSPPPIPLLCWGRRRERMGWTSAPRVPSSLCLHFRPTFLRVTRTF